MGIFNKTEEEIRKDEENRKYRVLIDAIWQTTITDSQRDILFQYIDQVRKGQRRNDFGDVDTLSAIFIRMAESGFEENKDFRFFLTEVIKCYHMIVDSSDENMDRIRERFIEELPGKDGFLDLDIFREDMFGAFQNKEDYFEVMDVIQTNPVYYENIDTVSDYIVQVGKYCFTQDILKRDVLAFLNEFDDVLDGNYQKYCKQQLLAAQKRIGMSNIDPKDIAKVDTKLHRIEGYCEQIDLFIKQIQVEKESINAQVESGKQEIKGETKNSIDTLKVMIITAKKDMLDKLEQYALDLKSDIQNVNDVAKHQALEELQKKCNELRSMLLTYSTSLSKDLSAAQREVEDKLNELQEFAFGDSQFQHILTRAQEENELRTRLINLVNKEEELITLSDEKKSDEVSIPGYEKHVMVPYRHLVLPSEISSIINPFFDEKIPFSKREEELYKRIEQREKRGEIFHKKIPQLAINIMEGDWSYLWGPSGTGKSYMIKQLAVLLGMPLTKAGKITEPYSILGYNDPQGRYQITPSFVATLYGHLLLLDEMDNGNPDTQVVLNDIYSELLNKLEEPNENFQVTFGTDILVDVHPNFRMIAAGNTSGGGENDTFSSRGKMDESILQRLTPVYIDYDPRVEERILHDYPEWYKFFVEFRRICLEYAKDVGMVSAQGITTTRDASAIKKYILHNSKSLDQIIEEKFTQTKDPEYIKAVARSMADIYTINYESCKDFTYNDPLEKATGKVLAKKLVVASKWAI